MTVFEIFALGFAAGIIFTICAILIWNLYDISED